jgi:hypothetical protein
LWWTLLEKCGGILKFRSDKFKTDGLQVACRVCDSLHATVILRLQRTQEIEQVLLLALRHLVKIPDYGIRL